MAQRLRHRGPDGEGVWSEPGVALSHRRLAILDLTDAGHQPMVFGSHVLTYNGEIYNHERLRARLPGPWHSSGDTEVLLHLLATARQRLPRPPGRHVRLRRVGTRARSACCWRAIGSASSRCTTGCCRTASRSPRNSRRCWCWASREIDPQRGARFSVSRLYSRAENDLSRHLRSCRPATRSPGRTGACSIERYWNPSTAIVARSAERHRCSELDALLREVVPAHTLSDVPVGVFLSGGIDSALTAYYLGRAAHLHVWDSMRAAAPKRMRRAARPRTCTPCTWK